MDGSRSDGAISFKIRRNTFAEFGVGCFQPVCVTKVKYDASVGFYKIISRSDLLGRLTGLSK